MQLTLVYQIFFEYARAAAAVTQTKLLSINAADHLRTSL